MLKRHQQVAPHNSLPRHTNLDCPLGMIRQVFQGSVRPEPVEGPVLSLLVVRQAHHERPNELF